MQGVVESTLRFAGNFDRIDSTYERLEYQLGFNSCDRLTDTGVNACAEPDMCQNPALQIEALRILPMTRITIGCGQEQ